MTNFLYETVIKLTDLWWMMTIDLWYLMEVIKNETEVARHSIKESCKKYDTKSNFCEFTYESYSTWNCW